MLNDIKHRDPLELFVWLIGIIKRTNMNLLGEFSCGIDDFCIRLNAGHVSKLAQRREKETVATADIQNFSSRRQRFCCFLVPAIESF